MLSKSRTKVVATTSSSRRTYLRINSLKEYCKEKLINTIKGFTYVE